MRTRESEEMYLETILLLKQKSANVHSVDVVGELNYAKSSVFARHESPRQERLHYDWIGLPVSLNLRKRVGKKLITSMSVTVC